ncbi:thioredoxin family protein [Asaia bogorensis]|uniref:thioredoxin family protein n=1 Tax=Asaia bogorensis TaxID=91915 RepID=UPI0028641443|nr:thioredoxin family protein [Asaia bogorensis]MDR6181599.1 thioredoxin 1 [Asaia bogorensis NBRC 16594]
MFHRKFGVLTSLALGLSTLSVAAPTLISNVAYAEDGPPAPPVLDKDVQITPAKDVYPDIALAKKQVEEAFATAARTKRKVLIDFGGNWCPDCRMLAGIFEQPEVAQWLESQFVVVPVNVGRIDQNLDIAKQYGVTIHEVPTVLIVTPGRTLLNADGANTLGNARAMSTQAVLDLLDKWNRRG